MKLSLPTSERIYKTLFILLCGVLIGVFITLKYLVPDGTDIYIGKIKVRGSGNIATIENVVKKR